MTTIYEYIKSNFKIDCSQYNFTRDYIKQPLQKYREPIRNQLTYEFPNRDDFIYLYITLNLSQNELCKLFGVSKLIIIKTIKEYNIVKSRHLGILNRNKKNLKKYGTITPSKLQSLKDKQEQTNLVRYGFKSSFQNISIKDKAKKTNLEKYGCENVFQNKDIIIKSKQTKFDIYGNENFTNHQKAYNTKLEKYGNGNYTNYKQIKQTNLEKYGCENVFCLKEVKEKTKETNLKKYGNETFLGSNEHKNNILLYMNKSYITKKRNKSFNTSKYEEIIYQKLLSKYVVVYRQYKSDLYPYACDFYIPEIDTYIEYNGWWGHGKEPFIGNDEQLEKVKLWESKNTSQYNRAIDNWTKRDVLKRNTANNNNLNYLEFFNMDEFNKWYDTNPFKIIDRSKIKPTKK